MTDDLPELTREDAIEAMQDMAYDLYRAQDRVALVREMLDAHTGPLDAAMVRAWLDQPACPRAESEQQTIARLEATLAAVREYVETSDDDGVAAREIVLAILGGKTREQAEADRYDRRLRAPLSRAAAEELGRRLASGKYARRKVRGTAVPDAAGRSRAAADSGEQR